MKKFLPVLFSLLFLFISLVSPVPVNAQQQLDTLQAGQVPAGDWRIDPEVTFIGKNAARSGNLLDFTLENYNWVCIAKDSNGQCDNSNNPLTGVWLTTVTYIVVPLLFIVIISAAVVIIITRGRSITIMRFLPRFVGVLLLIFLSFALLQFFYQFIDVIQGFFLRKSTEFTGGISCPPECISQEDLLFVGWDYQNFIGLRRAGGEGDQFAESAFISLLLTKLTALTYYVMVGILVLRKIILWLFIIVSPVFPILLLFYPIRNTGKIWIGEFFRWLLYAPLFAIFLKGLVVLWREGIPLVFNTISRDDTSQIVYPTAVNILLGGPKEFVTPTNSINLTESFALYVFSLLMLWGVIILPWILLQIFLDYASSLAVSESPVMKSLISKVNNLKPPPSSPSPSPAGGGTTINLPFAKKFNLPIPPSTPTGLARSIPTSVSERKTTEVQYMPSAQIKAQTMSIVDMNLPTIRDIAKYDSSLISNDKDKQRETIQIREKLEKIANPALSTTSSERERFTEIRSKLEKESTSGNTLAASILNAASMTTKQSVKASTTQIKNALTQIANPERASAFGATSVVNKEKLTKMNESLVQAKREGNTLAASILSVTDRTPAVEIEKLQERIMDAKAKGEPIASQIADIAAKNKTVLPAANRIQTVSREDYDEVEKMWEENYRNLEVPSGMAGTRTEWIKDDIAKIDSIIAQLSSPDQEKVASGMNEVSGILPFLLVGGFSITEIIAYLHAKQDAGKKTIAELAREEEDKIEVKVKKTKTAAGHLTASASEGADIGDDADDSSLATVSSAPITQISDEILGMVNIKLPKISDLARYETLSLSKDKEKLAEIDNIQQTLKSINDPSGVSSPADKEKYQNIKEKLMDESRKGNPIASAVLSAASGVSALRTTTPDAKTVLTQIANPSLAGTESDRERFVALHEQLAKASQTGDQLAVSLLSVKETASKEEIENLSTKLKEQKDSGHPLAASVLSNISSPLVLPATNRIQSVSEEDYRTVKKLWKENYTNLEIPKEMAETRSEWIKNDISKIDTIINQLNSTDPKEVNKAMEDVSAIVPFLLVGGFSQSEIISYLKAKKEAASEVLSIVTKEENETLVTVNKKQVEVPQMAQAAHEENVVSPDIKTQQFSDNSQMITPITRDPILTLSNLKLPKLSDIVSFEVRNITKDKTESQRVEQIHEVLERINNPAVISSSADREKYDRLRTTLMQEASKGNPTAEIVLSAVTQLAKIAEDIDLTLSELKVVLSLIVNPEKAEHPDDRDYYTRLHEYLEKESKEKNNTLARSILSVSETTGNDKIQEIKEQLSVSERGDSPLPEITSAVKEIAQVKDLKEIISQIVSNDSAKPESSATIISIRENVEKAQQAGNSLAGSILAVSQSAPDSEVRSVYQNLVKSAQSGDSFAQNLLSQITVSSSDAVSSENVSNEEVKNILEKIANPDSATSKEEKNYFTVINSEFKKESGESVGTIAQKILSVNNSTTNAQVQDIRNQIFQSVQSDPSPALQKTRDAFSEYLQIKKIKEIASISKTSLTQSDIKITESLRKELIEESAKGNPLAVSVLSVNSSTPDAKVRQIHTSLQEASKKGDKLAKSVLAHVSKKAELSQTNRLQKVTPEDYAQARELWEKAYKQYFVPEGFTEDVKGRMEWIQSDMADIEETINLLSSPDSDKKDEGMKKVSNILPFLLLGGFSFEEMLTYLRTKLDAAKAALKSIQEEEENSVQVPAGNGNSDAEEKLKQKEAETDETEKNN
jgi:hypothetical protein